MTEQTNPLNRVTLRNLRHRLDQARESRAAVQGAVDLFFRITTNGPIPECGPDAALISSEDLISLYDAMHLPLYELMENLDGVHDMLKVLELDAKTADPFRETRQTETA
jgi:hypothetical protein